MRTTFLVAALCAAGWGCTTDFSSGDDADTSTQDTAGETDVPADSTTPDTSADTSPDTGHDTGVDTSPDTGFDTSPDTALDTLVEPEVTADTVEEEVTVPCDRHGFDPVTQTAQRNPDIFFYQAQSATAEPYDVFTIEFYYGFGDPPPLDAPGTYVLAETPAEQDYATCGTCVRILADFVSGAYSTIFLATGGTLELTDFGEAAGELVSGELTGVTLVEVTIDPATYESTPVPDGEGWCIELMTFEAPIVP